MKTPLLISLLSAFLMTTGHSESPTLAVDAKAAVDKVVAAVGGADKLLKLFRMKEQFNFGSELATVEKSSKRESIVEPPTSNWWIAKTLRTDPEPAKEDAYAWTLGVLLDAKSKIEIAPDIMEAEKPLFGIKVSGTIEPAMEMYFDKADSRLVRIDWRTDIYRFSEWKECDGVKYAAKTVMYKKATGKAWFFHEITELKRLLTLPEGLVRKP